MMSLKKLIAVLAVSLPLAAAAQAPALKFKLSGDLNHRFAFTNQTAFFGAAETIRTAGTIRERHLDDLWGEFKYRLTIEAGPEDGSVKGVYGLEIGAIRFGNSGTKAVGADAIGTQGGGYSGDGDNYETRWAYIDFGLPTAKKNRVQVGLLPFVANKYLWAENATGIQLKGDFAPVSYTLAWMRGDEIFNNNTPTREVYADSDAYFLRGDFAPMKDMKAGAFVLYEHRQGEGRNGAFDDTFPFSVTRTRDFGGANIDHDKFTLGVDGAMTFGNIFVNADLMYQFGSVHNFAVVDPTTDQSQADIAAYFLHADVGVNLGAAKVTYTGWYSSGQDFTDQNERDLTAFTSTDVNIFDSIVFHQGGYTDDTYFTNSPYFGLSGAFFNKLALDYKVSPKVTVGAAALYIMTAEDVILTVDPTTGAPGKKSKEMGTEFDAYISYKVNPNVELALNAGYLIAGDAMDAWEAAPIGGNGKADEDLWRTTGRIRYTF